MRQKILSIQSHVAYGYVGNRAAVFPLQCMGYDVIAVNTVQFSNHTGYGAWTGEVCSAEHIHDVLKGIHAHVETVDAVLSGYMGDAEIGEAILDAVNMFNAPVYCCDPVMGDVGRDFFVRPGIPEYMKDRAVPSAKIITPNQFELNYLTGKDVRSVEHAKEACQSLHDQGVEMVLVTSFEYEGLAEDQIAMFLSHADGGNYITITQKYPLDPAPNGAGDMVAALFLGHYLAGTKPQQALEATAQQTEYVFGLTHKASQRELDLIGGKSVFQK